MPASTIAPSTRVERYDTIVIGAGQAGLAVGHHLARADAEFLILDAGARIGDSWRQRWDSLRVFTSAEFTGLPGMPFPAPRGHRPDKDELADYLERYADRFDLPVRLGTPVQRLTRSGGRYVIDTSQVRYEARNVVVATGPFQAPRIPAVAGALSPDIHQLHSRDYRSPFALPEGPVLVVGMGNAGMRIALEIARFRPVTLAGPPTRHLPSTVLGRDIHWWLWPLVRHLTVDTWLGRRLRALLRHDPVVGVSEAQLTKAGVRRAGRVTDALGGRPVADGRPLDVNTIVWCTGFAPDFGWIDVQIPRDQGEPITQRGAVAGAPGLYFVGLRFQRTLASALLAGVGDDAAHVAARILAEERDAGRAR